MSTTFTIDLDVSRAITAQQQLISKFEDIAKAGPKIGQALNPLKKDLKRHRQVLKMLERLLELFLPLAVFLQWLKMLPTSTQNLRR